MAKIKLTKNELKHQRDALKRFQRYLPTLQLKKTQLQLEVRQMREELDALRAEAEENLRQHQDDLALLAGAPAEQFQELLTVTEWRVATRNIAGIDVPVFGGIDFNRADYDLFSTPLWLDDILALIEHQTQSRLNIQLVNEQLSCVESELRAVSQRVNLFEKVKIPEAQENIRRINIYIGDQQTNAVGRSKIAKGKCQARDAELN